MNKEPTFTVDNIVRWTYKLLRERPEMFKLEKLHINTAGLYHTVSQRIVINYRADILSVLIHEVLHHLYPNWPERKVLNGESFIMKHMSQRTAITILKRFANIL